jgi:hypothetical protein
MQTRVALDWVRQDWQQHPTLHLQTAMKTRASVIFQYHVIVDSEPFA